MGVLIREFAPHDVEIVFESPRAAGIALSLQIAPDDVESIADEYRPDARGSPLRV